MADEILDAHEQSERARRWLQENGASILVGVLLAVGGIIGYDRWKDSGQNHRAEALVKYEEVAAAIEKSDKELAGKLIEDIKKNYQDTPHAALAAMEAAEMALSDQKADVAASELSFAVEHARTDALRQLAALRLARVQIGQGQAQAALKTLEKVVSEGMAADRDTIKGDAHAALGQRDQALAAYEAALTRMDVAATQRRTVEMKRDDMRGPAPVVAEAAPPPAAAPAARADASAPAATEAAAEESKGS